MRGKPAGTPAAEWDGAAVRVWVERRLAAAQADQVVAERGGWDRHDDCDAAAAEEMVCASLLRSDAASASARFIGEVKAMLDRDDYVWRGVYDDSRFDRHVRAYLRKLARMAKTNKGFANVRRYQ